MPQYKDTNIPQEIWDFFETEPGLSTKQLTQAIDRRTAIHPFYTFTFTYEVIVNFRGGFDLIRYYRKNSKLSVEELLQYDYYAIRDFICHDEHFKFHNWLLRHNLTMPHNLTRDHWQKISTLCSESGIEYLNRKIIALPEPVWQTELDQLVVIGSFELDQDIKSKLRNVLEAIPDTTNRRFLAYKKKELKKEAALASEFTINGMHSLFWLSAKKVAKLSLETTTINKNLQKAVAAAKTLKLL